MTKYAIVLIGAPGSGKGTQDQNIEDNFPLKKYIMSDLLKEEINTNPKIKELISNGILIDDETVLNIFKNKFNNEEMVLIDGIPRTEEQAIPVKNFLLENNYKIIVVNLLVDQSKLIERITNRYSCPKCGASYNLIYIPPKNKGVCDNDGEKLIQRSDDTEEVFSKRIKIFNDSIEGVIKTFESSENIEICDINADLAIDKVGENIVNSLKKIIT